MGMREGWKYKFWFSKRSSRKLVQNPAQHYIFIPVNTEVGFTIPIRDSTSLQDAYGVVTEEGSVGMQDENVCQIG